MYLKQDDLHNLPLDSNLTCYIPLSSVLVSILALNYILTRSRKIATSKSKRNKTQNKPKTKKIKYQFTKRPIRIHFVMGNEYGLQGKLV